MAGKKEEIEKIKGILEEFSRENIKATIREMGIADEILKEVKKENEPTNSGKQEMIPTSPATSWPANCSIWHTECHYECIEYYPNGKDCRKTKKICVRVCDDFDVIISGDTVHTPIEPNKSGKVYIQSVMETTKIIGTIEKIVVVGGETTGWAIELDSLIEGIKLRHIEVDPNDKNIEQFKNKKVQLTGTLEWRQGIGRGAHPVIVIETINEFDLEQ